MAKHPQFDDVNRQYDLMKAAKKQLKLRFEIHMNQNTEPDQSEKDQRALKMSNRQVKVGEECEVIEAWSLAYNEIEELKKVFFEFLKRWVENDGRQKNINAPILYETLQDQPLFMLSSD